MSLLDTLKCGKILVSDGATGTMLIEKGLRPGQCPEEWNVSHPDAVASIPKAYFDAGADVALTNTFGLVRTKLKAYGFETRGGEFAREGVRLAKSVRPAGRYVAGSLGPTGEFLAPAGSLTEEDLRALFGETIDAFVAAGVDAICLETFSALDEAQCAVRLAKERSRLPVICTMTFASGPRGCFTTTGATPRQAAKGLAAAGADVIGTNCGNGIAGMIPVTREMREVSDLPILVHANAGLPQLIDGRTCYLDTPEQMAGHVAALVEAGASIIGGCCGTTPAHVRAIRRAVDALARRR